jgi:hypothetical protein
MATTVAWSGLTLSRDSGHRIDKVEGWAALPPARYDKTPRARGHGAHSSPVWADERTVTVTGSAHSEAERDRLLAELERTFTFAEDDAEQPLAITLADRTLTAGAQLLSADPVIAAGSFNVGLIQWRASWRCPDPLRYGPPQQASTGLPSGGGGLAYPIAYPTRYGALGDPGQLLLTNAGTAPAPAWFTVTTPAGLDSGFELSAAGRRITYASRVPPGQTISIDTDTGQVLAEGTASRRGELTFAEWFQVPRADPVTGTPGELIVQFTSLGGAHDPGARLAARWADTYW